MEVLDLDAILAEAQRHSLTRDNPALNDLPDWFTELRSHQRIAVREILTAYEEGAKCVVLDAPTGCLSGDTIITVNRGGNAKKVRLDKLVHSFRGGATIGGHGSVRKWDLSIPTQIQCADNGFIRLGRLTNAWASGIKETYLVTTASGSIRATLTHPFLTEDGYELLGNLSPGHLVGVRGTRKAKGTYVKKHYQCQARLYHHPYATGRKTYSKGTDGWRVPTHRLIMEASINGVDYEEYLMRLTIGEVEGLVFLDPAVDAVHHKDGDSLNNRLSNLEVLPHLEHWAMEGREHGWKNCAFPVVFEPITSIELHGEEMTYDLEMAEEPHNFIANGYAVHNSGKTLIGETVRRILGGLGRQSVCSYICSSKALQDQFVKDYPYAKVLKGRSNYATELYPERFTGRDPLSAADCTKTPGDSESCLWCSSTAVCPYERAKLSALRSDLAVLNTSYFLSECNGPGRFSRGGLVIADEADMLESELMSHVEVRVSERRLKQYGLSTPRFVTKPESWRDWAEEATEVISSHRPKPGPDAVRNIREAKRHGILVGKVRALREGLESGNWVYTGDRQSVAFKPVTVDRVGQDKLWQHGDKWLLMSATVISADEMLESLGWDEDEEWRLVKCPSTFPKENRKVVVWPIVSMNYKNREAAWPEVVKGVEAIALEGEASTGKMLIHSSSYSLTIHIAEALEDACLGRPIFYYTSAAGKEAAFNNWQASVNGIMVAPSLDRGIDLPGDKCRTQVIVKVPFLSIKDKQVSARLYGTGRSGKIWYAVNAIRTIIQMCGRAVRSEEDYATTYILDKQFVDNLYSSYRNLIPNWWREALVWKKGSV